MATSRRWLVTTGTVLLVVVGCLIGAALTESAYRLYLYAAHPERFVRRDRGNYIVAYNVSHWEFDEEFGYVYPPGRVIDWTRVIEGRVRDCDRVSVINAYGNIGKILGNYETANLKVLVFGDSWAAFQQENRNWPMFLQDVLEARLGKKVHVVNFGRDGYGILQMFDLAAAKIVEWKPDLVLFTFITDDLSRARFWRTVVGRGDDIRVLTTTEPRRNPDLSQAADTYPLFPPATYEWCQEMRKTRGMDAVLERLVKKHDVLLEHSNPSARVTTNVLTLRHSYLYNRIVGDHDPFAFHRKPAVSTNPRVSFQSYAEDPRFMRALDRVNKAAVPWLLFHLAFYPEIKAGKEYILGPQEESLLASLETLTGKKALRTTDYVPMPLPQPERMSVEPNDYHPSVWGMKFYANAVGEALLRNGVLRDLGRAAPKRRDRRS